MARSKPEVGKTAGREATREKVQQYATDGGVLPIDALMNNVRYYYDESLIATTRFHEVRERVGVMPKAKRQQAELSDARRAVNSARLHLAENATEAAPFFHPKLQNVAHEGGDVGKPILYEFTGADTKP